MDLIAIDTIDGPIFLPRVAAQALASGGQFDRITECVIGGNPDHTGLPQNARELTESENEMVVDRVRKSLSGDKKTSSILIRLLQGMVNPPN